LSDDILQSLHFDRLWIDVELSDFLENGLALIEGLVTHVISYCLDLCEPLLTGVTFLKPSQFWHGCHKATAFLEQGGQVLKRGVLSASTERLDFPTPFIHGIKLVLQISQLWSREAELLSVFKQFLHSFQRQLLVIFLSVFATNRLFPPDLIVLATVLLLTHKVEVGFFDPQIALLDKITKVLESGQMIRNLGAFREKSVH
jgi:hypothetical protein